MRKEGYYWVKYIGAWEIAHWHYIKIINETRWNFFMEIMRDSDFDEIDERQIVRTEPCKVEPPTPDDLAIDAFYRKPKMSKEQITKAEELISDTIRKVDKLFGLL